METDDLAESSVRSLLYGSDISGNAAPGVYPHLQTAAGPRVQAVRAAGGGEDGPRLDRVQVLPGSGDGDNHPGVHPAGAGPEDVPTLS